MPDFASAADLEEYLGDRYLVIADRDHDGVADAALVASSLTRASGLVGGYITKYLPLAVVVPEVTQATLDVATFYLAGNMKSEQERERFEDTIKWLRDVSKGLATLPVPDEEPVSAGTIEVVSAERALSRSSLERLM